MKITITDQLGSKSFSLPNSLLLNRVTARIAVSSAARYHPVSSTISQRAMETLFDQVKACQKQYGSWVLVEVRSADGRNIEITL